MVVRPLSEWGWGRVGAREEERGGEKRGDRGGIRRVLEGEKSEGRWGEVGEDQ